MKDFAVLVVEDDLVTLLTLSKAIRKGIPGVLLLTAHSLAEARLTLQEYTVHFLVLDINLPDGSGIDFIFDVTVNNPQASIVLMTSTPLPEYRDQAAAFGVMNFLPKPVDHASLVTMIRESRKSPVGSSDEESSQFDISLSRLTALDILQLKCLNNTTQAILFKSGKHGPGRVYFQKGQIIHAETEKAKGMAALTEILSWKSGHAEEIVEHSAAEHTISSVWQTTLLIAAQAADEGAAG